MALYVLAYPHLSTADFDWIQAIRAVHDPQYELVEPHFTLVFGVSDIAPDSLIDRVIAATQEFPLIHFALRCATIVKDSFSPLTHTFLVPDEGFSHLVRLHDALYAGALAPALRLDVPFIPHITIAGALEAQACKKLADELNQEQFCITGQIEQLEVVNLVQGHLSSLAIVPLKL